jgi:hypothetical protein
MKMITKKAVAAFLAGREFKSGGTKVVKTDLGMRYYLHNNLIAGTTNGKLEITNAGWPTRTTYERLNGLPGVRIHVKGGLTYLNGKEWDGGWIEIKTQQP